jgi:putative addiction module component (TIGR02574 family)
MSQIEVPPEILKMPVTDRLELVGKIWDSISHDGFPPITESTRALIDARIEEADANTEGRIPAKSVFDDMRRKGIVDEHFEILAVVHGHRDPDIGTGRS